MPRTFAYDRVSTPGQTTGNQIQETEAAGFKVDAPRVVAEKVSGSSAIEQPPGFMKLLDRLEQDDVLIVSKLDRLRVRAVRASGGRRTAVLEGKFAARPLPRQPSKRASFGESGSRGRLSHPPPVDPDAVNQQGSTLRRQAPGSVACTPTFMPRLAGWR